MTARLVDPIEKRADDAAGELCSVLDVLDALRECDGDALGVSRAQVERWTRQIGRALLVVEEVADPARQTPSAEKTS